jgi:hypothetical protein
MSAGLTLLKEHAAGTIARQFQAAGISALAPMVPSFVRRQPTARGRAPALARPRGCM